MVKSAGQELNTHGWFLKVEFPVNRQISLERFDSSNIMLVNGFAQAGDCP